MRRVEFELAACDVIACPDHPEKQWLALEVIANHLGLGVGDPVFLKDAMF